MPNVVYDNFYLSNEVEDQLITQLDLQRFATIDNNLVGEPGMVRKINIYSGTDGAQILALGSGNTTSIEVSYTPKEYRIETLQARFQYYDEEAMTDPMLVPVGVRKIGVDIANALNQSVIDELVDNTGIYIPGATIDFDVFADAQALMNIENLEGTELYALISPTDAAALRKALKATLQYVEAFARQGYIGTVAGVNVYICKALDKGDLVIAARDAVTIFNKSGVDIEQIVNGTRSETAANVRQNTVFGRKYFITAMTRPNHAAYVTTASDAMTSATGTAVAGTMYYEKVGTNYTYKPVAVGASVTGLYKFT